MFQNLQETIVYGPVNSRRLGDSLGINLFPNDRFKICNFNCKYCFFKTDSTKINTQSFIKNTTPESVIDELELWKNNKQYDFSNSHYLTFSGNGEPTIHPLFPEIIERVVEWRNKNIPNKKIAIFTNGCNLSEPSVKDGILKCDNIFVKFDVGTENDFNLLYRPLIQIDFANYIKNISNIVKEANNQNKNLIIQSAILETILTDKNGIDIYAWVDRIKEIKPHKIDLYELNLDGTSFQLKEFFDFREYKQTILKLFEKSDIQIEFFTKAPKKFSPVFIQYAVDSLLYLPVYIADKANLFYRNGIEPNFLESTNGDLGAIQAVIRGDADFSLCDPFVVFSDKIKREDRKKCSLIEIFINKVGLWSLCDKQIKNIEDIFETKEKIYTYPEESTAYKVSEWFNKHKKVIKTNNPGSEFDFACTDYVVEGEDPIDNSSIITADLLSCKVCLSCWKMKHMYSNRKIFPFSDSKNINPFLFTGLIVNTEYMVTNPELAKKTIYSVNKAIRIFQDDSYLRYHKEELLDYLIDKIGRKEPPFIQCSLKPNIRANLSDTLVQIRKENIYKPRSMLNTRSLINAFHLHNSFNKSISLNEFFRYLEYYNTKNRFRLSLLKIFLVIMWIRIKIFPSHRKIPILIFSSTTLLSFLLKIFSNKLDTIGDWGALASILGLIIAIFWRK